MPLDLIELWLIKKKLRDNLKSLSNDCTKKLLIKEEKVSEREVDGHLFIRKYILVPNGGMVLLLKHTELMSEKESESERSVFEG